MLLTKVSNFWREGYLSDPFAFYMEMVSAISVIIGSSILTYTVLAPRPDIFVPFYFVGSSTGLYAAILRKTPWVTVLTGWFTIMNTIALYQLFLI